MPGDWIQVLWSGHDDFQTPQAVGLLSFIGKRTKKKVVTLFEGFFLKGKRSKKRKAHFFVELTITNFAPAA
jgi:hypothetical protein